MLVLISAKTLAVLVLISTKTLAVLVLISAKTLAVFVLIYQLSLWLCFTESLSGVVVQCIERVSKHLEAVGYSEVGDIVKRQFESLVKDGYVEAGMPQQAKASAGTGTSPDSVVDG